MGKVLEEKDYIERIIKDIKPIKMAIEDLPQIAEIFISYWGTMGLYHDTVFERIINQNMSYVYKIHDEVIAFCLMSYDYNDDIVEVDLLCVKKKYKGFHLGKNILSFCIDNCIKLNYNNFCLHVSTTNTPAFNLYKKLGFEIKEFIAEYYSDEKPEDRNAYYMELKI